MAPNPGKHEVLMRSWKHQLSILTVYYALSNLWSCAPLHLHRNFGLRPIFVLRYLSPYCLDLSVARRVDLLTKHSLRSFWLKQKWNRIINTRFIHSWIIVTGRPGLELALCSTCFLCTDIWHTHYKGRARTFIPLEESEVSVSWVCQRVFQERTGFYTSGSHQNIVLLQT